jgi:hypothetical protein
MKELTQKDKLNIALELINQILAEQYKIDAEFKRQKIAAHKSMESVGESFSVFHLKELRELIRDLV